MNYENYIFNPLLSARGLSALNIIHKINTITKKINFFCDNVLFDIQLLSLFIPNLGRDNNLIKKSDY